MHGRRIPVHLSIIAAVGVVMCASPGAGGREEIEPLTIEIGGLAFDALAAGPAAGPVVFMLHGFPESMHEWRRQIPVLASMGFRVIAPNQRGYSPGARPEGVEAYAIPHLVADVIGMADAVGAERFHLVGHDWGAAVTWFTALAHPDRVISIVPISVPHPAAFARALADPEGEQAEMSSYMETFRAEGAEERFLADDAAMLRQVLGSLDPEDARRHMEVLGTTGAMGAALNWYRAMNLEAAVGEMTPIRMPTMFVWSTGDVALGRQGAELTAEYVEGPYRFEVLEGVSHWVPEEAPDALNDLLREHFAPFAP